MPPRPRLQRKAKSGAGSLEEGGAAGAAESYGYASAASAAAAGAARMELVPGSADALASTAALEELLSKFAASGGAAPLNWAATMAAVAGSSAGGAAGAGEEQELVPSTSTVPPAFDEDGFRGLLEAAERKMSKLSMLQEASAAAAKADFWRVTAESQEAAIETLTAEVARLSARLQTEGPLPPPGAVRSSPLYKTAQAEAAEAQKQAAAAQAEVARLREELERQRRATAATQRDLEVATAGQHQLASQQPAVHLLSSLTGLRVVAKSGAAAGASSLAAPAPGVYACTSFVPGTQQVLLSFTLEVYEVEPEEAEAGAASGAAQLEVEYVPGAGCVELLPEFLHAPICFGLDQAPMFLAKVSEALHRAGEDGQGRRGPAAAEDDDEEGMEAGASADGTARQLQMSADQSIMNSSVLMNTSGSAGPVWTLGSPYQAAAAGPAAAAETPGGAGQLAGRPAAPACTPADGPLALGAAAAASGSARKAGAGGGLMTAARLAQAASRLDAMALQGRPGAEAARQRGAEEVAVTMGMDSVPRAPLGLLLATASASLGAPSEAAGAGGAVYTPAAARMHARMGFATGSRVAAVPAAAASGAAAGTPSSSLEDLPRAPFPSVTRAAGSGSLSSASVAVAARTPGHYPPSAGGASHMAEASAASLRRRSAFAGVAWLGGAGAAAPASASSAASLASGRKQAANSSSMVMTTPGAGSVAGAGASARKLTMSAASLPSATAARRRDGAAGVAAAGAGAAAPGSESRGHVVQPDGLHFVVSPRAMAPVMEVDEAALAADEEAMPSAAAAGLVTVGAASSAGGDMEVDQESSSASWQLSSKAGAHAAPAGSHATAPAALTDGL